MVNKRAERVYLEWARAHYALFPSGDISESEEPDYIVSGPEGPLGVEVTQLFQPCSDSNFTPKQTESFQEKVIRGAEDIYYKAQGHPVDVRVYFSIRPNQKQDKQQLACAIADFVHANYPQEKNVLRFRESDPATPLPPGLGAISIARPLSDPASRWFAGAAGKTELLTYELVAETIAKKNARIPSYRAHAKWVWLLIVVDLFPSSATFSAPREIEAWKFCYDFDQVLLLSREEEKVWALSRRV